MPAFLPLRWLHAAIIDADTPTAHMPLMLPLYFSPGMPMLRF